MIPQYKNHYKSSVGLLFRQLQDIEIYVEDKDSEVFYRELFGRLLEGRAQIKKVISLGCRNEVIKGAEEQANDAPKVFVIDADLFWVTQQFNTNNKRIYQYPFYCVENSLFCKSAAITLIQETLGDKKRELIESELDWNSWIQSIEPHLIELFVIFATAFKLNPTIKTTSRGFEAIVTKTKKAPVIFDIEKVTLVISEIKNELLKDFSLDEIEKTAAEIENWTRDKEHNLNIVSGKNFLLPLLSFKLKEHCNLDLTVKSRNYRLARNCNLEPLDGLRVFVEDTIEKFHAA
ncbi:DUF4435 domain-containing protein [Shewanella sp. 125m-7]